MEYCYSEPKKITKAEFSQIIDSGIVVSICDAIIGSVHFIDDYDWLVQQYILLLNYTDQEIQGAVITSIGHLARLNKKANQAQLLNILEPLLFNDALTSRVEDAIDDINTFCILGPTL
ncbi:MAG: hypothetical protein HC877_07265 [Thioploca sp.]|nr:hypothetical protein [Thioploca sp.]